MQPGPCNSAGGEVAINVPSLHVCPMYRPGKQWHLYPFVVSSHVAPFLQGFLAHLSVGGATRGKRLDKVRREHESR